MVWGCMFAAGVGELVFIEKNMNGKLYLPILKENFKKSAESFNILETFMLYSDNDYKHKEKKCKREWLLYHCSKVLQTPAQSENLWDELDKRVRKPEISSKNDLKCCLKEEWHKISTSYIIKLVEGMPARLQSVLNKKG